MSDSRAVIYCRVSTLEQDNNNQLEVLKAWASARGYDIIKVYSESASAWHEGHQRELSRLIDGARQGKYKTIMVWSLDRLSRQGALAILELINKLSAWGVKILSYQESWTEAPGELAELLYALTGWVARMESQRRSERTKAGMLRAGRAGQHLGRPRGSRDKKRRKVRVIR